MRVAVYGINHSVSSAGIVMPNKKSRRFTGKMDKGT